MDIPQKILATGLLFLFIGVVSVAVRVNDKNISDTYKATFGFFIFGGAACAMIGALTSIWF